MEIINQPILEQSNFYLADLCLFRLQIRGTIQPNRGKKST